MTRMSWVLACVLAFAVGGAETRLPAQSASPRDTPERGVLAVMRRDGLLLPFAAFKGARWIAPWPARATGQELPVTIDAVPESWWGGEAPGPWTLRLPGGVTRAVTSRTPRVYRSFCDTRIGVETDYRSAEPIPMPPTDPYPKDGLAVSPDVNLLPIESVDRAAPEAAQLARTLLPEFDRAEDKTLAMIRSRESWKHPLGPEGRRVRPVTIEAWYRAPMNEPGWTASYIEAVRSYSAGPAGGDGGCGLETVFTGWIHQNTDDPRKTRMQLTARVTYCDRRGVKYMLPFGRMQLGHDQFWVYQLSGFDEEWYQVARISPLKMSFVVESFGGGRSSCSVRGGPR